MEYLPLGDLSRYLKDPLPEPQAASISLQVLEGLRFIYQTNFAHRDLKPNNLLVQHAGPSWWVKISDFGTSKEMGIATLCSNVGTVAYQAPEVRGIVKSDNLAGGNQLLSPSVDIWAVGAIAFRLTSGRVPFEDLLSLCRYVGQSDPFPFENGISEKSNTVSASELDVIRTDHPMTALVIEQNSIPDLTEDASAEWPPTEPCNEPPPCSANFPIDVSYDADFTQPIQQDGPTSPNSDSQRVASAETGDNGPRLMDVRKSDAFEHNILPRHTSKPSASSKRRQSPPRAEYPESGRRKSRLPKLPLSFESQGCRLEAVEYSDDRRTLFLTTNHYIHTYHSVGQGQWDQGTIIDIRRRSLSGKIWEGIKPIDIPDDGIHSFVIAGCNPAYLIGLPRSRIPFTIPLEEEITASAISANGQLLIISYSHELQLWYLASQSLRQRIEVPDKTSAFVFSTDGSRFAQIISRALLPDIRGIPKGRIGDSSYIWEFDETTHVFANRDSFKGVVEKMLDAPGFLLSREGCLFLRRGSEETKLLTFPTPYHYKYCFSRDAQKLAIAY
uniref:Autophagy-related protein 1 n=1 Tax=Bionectria ochroleuca TaxID=29856 RepID=A0A0B7K6N1_BIOOC